MYVTNIFWTICQLNTLQISHSENSLLIHRESHFNAFIKISIMVCSFDVMFFEIFPCSEVTYSPIQKSWFCFSYLSLHMLPSLLVTKTVYPCLYLQDYFYFLHQMFYNRIVPVTFTSEFFQHIFLNLIAVVEVYPWFLIIFISR